MPDSKIEDVRIVREGSDEEGSWSVASLTRNGHSCLGIRFLRHESSQDSTSQEWFVLPSIFERGVLNAALNWNPEEEEAIRRGYEEQAAYEASTDDPFPWDEPAPPAEAALPAEFGSKAA